MAEMKEEDIEWRITIGRHLDVVGRQIIDSLQANGGTPGENIEMRVLERKVHVISHHIQFVGELAHVRSERHGEVGLLGAIQFRRFVDDKPVGDVVYSIYFDRNSKGSIKDRADDKSFQFNRSHADWYPHFRRKVWQEIEQVAFGLLLEA